MAPTCKFIQLILFKIGFGDIFGAIPLGPSSLHTEFKSSSSVPYFYLRGREGLVHVVQYLLHPAVRHAGDDGAPRQVVGQSQVLGEGLGGDGHIVCTHNFGIFLTPSPLYELAADLWYNIHATSLTYFPSPLSL